MLKSIFSGFHERYSLARAQTGFPVVIVLTAKIPCKAEIDTLRSHLESRIDQLLHIYPALSVSVIDDRSRQPSFIRKAGPALTHADILTTAQDIPNDFIDGGDDAVLSRILSHEHKRCSAKGNLLKIQGPMWRVVIRWQPGLAHCWLSLSVNHIIIDGKGAANLMEVLLMKDVSKTIPTKPLKALPPTSNEVFDMNPPYRHVVPIFFQELIVPLLPAFIRNRVQAKAHWPSNKPIAISPNTAEHMIDLITFDINTVIKLKNTATARGIKTVTPLLQLAAFIAASTLTEEGQSISTSTPINIRPQAGLDATFCTGNYVSLAPWSATASPSLAIWPITREYAKALVDPNTIKNGCWTFGMLAYIPDAMRDPPPSKQVESDAAIKDDDKTPTSWQHFFETKMNSQTPYTTSFGISNLGIIKTDMQVERLAWAQTAIPVGAAFIIDVCGFKWVDEDPTGATISGGLSISVGSRKGTVADGKVFATRIKRAIDVLANADLVPENMTLEGIIKLMSI
jgi:hypothetical protein